MKFAIFFIFKKQFFELKFLDTRIIEKEADDVPMIKDNQKELKEQVKKLFELHIDKESDKIVDTDHGRVETRKCEMIDDLKLLDGKEQWCELNSVVRINSTRFDKKSKKKTQEIRG